MRHFLLFFWTLRVLWGFKSINRIDRLRLWRKSVNLYLSFLAFTDEERPAVQLEGAVIGAVLSAVYDYDTDWPNGDREGKNFLPLLSRLVVNPSIAEMTRQLFINKLRKLEAGVGLVRGSTALHVYRALIGSVWMSRYTRDQIDEYGRKLQIIDDALDVIGDEKAGDPNCFLSSDSARYVREGLAFLDSEFYCELKRRSWLYRLFERRVRERLNSLGNGGTQ